METNISRTPFITNIGETSKSGAWAIFKTNQIIWRLVFRNYDTFLGVSERNERFAHYTNKRNKNIQASVGQFVGRLNHSNNLSKNITFGAQLRGFFSCSLYAELT